MRASLLFCCVFLLACGRARVAGVDPSDAGADDAAVPDAGLPDAGDGQDAGFDAGPPDAGFTTARVVLHLHSAISHDACDHHGADGGPLASLDQDCLDQLEAALCADHIDVAFLTDHPRFMDSKIIEDDVLLRGHGETALRDANGKVIGSLIPCGGGRSVQLAAGWEGTHTMPLGLIRLLEPGADDAYGTHVDATTSLADEQTALAEIHAAGGIFFTAHSEENDLPASVLQSLQTDGMEWYNVHGNFIALLGGAGDLVGGNVDLPHVKDLFELLKDLDPFLLGGNAQADLIYLPLLQAHFPEAGLQKWHDVLGARFVAGGLGNDVHRNVSVKPLCKGAAALAACQLAGAAYPNVITALAGDGQLLTSDGERIDTYARVLRWLNNRALVRDNSVAAARDAMGRGRSYGLFAVLGEPGAFAFQARTADGSVLEMGDSGAAAGATLLIRMPDLPAPELGAQWTSADAARAQLHALLWRTTSGGRELAGEWDSNFYSTRVEFPAAGQVGNYSLEIRLVPHHLDNLLQGARSLAAHEYRWILSNAIALH